METMSTGHAATTVGAVCVITAEAAPRPATARLRTAPVVATRSQAGVGSHGVSGLWRGEAGPGKPAMADHPAFRTDFDNYITRQGPPICSPPA